MTDEWPPPYEYIGRPTAWTRLTREFGDPVPHRHACPECYEHKDCTYPCTLVFDLEDTDGVPYGSHMVCWSCDQKIEIIENAILAAHDEVTKEEDRAVFDSRQLELDLGA